MRYLSVCSGIEAASVAFRPLGWTPLAFSEIEPFPRAVLEHHYPDVPLHGDFTTLKDEQWIIDADLLCGGCPCQSFSVAGLRKSLTDDRGNLTLQFIKLADAIDNLRRDAGREPAWILYENVPGILSTNDNAFGAFLGGICGREAAIPEPANGWTGAGVVNGPTRCAAWRTLDAQYFGVAQRRKRIFVLALGGVGRWRAADALLPIIESMSWNPPPSRGKGQRPTGTLEARTGGGGGLGTDFDLSGGLVEAAAEEVSAALGAQPNASHRPDSDTYVAHSLRREGFDASEDGTGRGIPLVPEVAGTLAPNTGPRGHDAGNFASNQGVAAGYLVPEVTGPLSANGGTDKKHGFGMGQQDWENGYAIPEVSSPLTVGASRSGGGAVPGSSTDGAGGLLSPETVGALCSHGDGTDGQDASGVRILPVEAMEAFAPSVANPLTARMLKGVNTTMDEGQTMVPVAFKFRGGGNSTGERGGVGTGGGGVGYLGQDECAFTLSTLEDQMIAAPLTLWEDADATKTNAGEALRRLRDAVDPQDFEEWAVGVITALRSSQILWSGLHGEELRREAERWDILGDDTLSREEEGAPWPVFRLWDAFGDRRTPSRWEPPEQLARELAAHLSVLPQQGASKAGFLHALWGATEGLGVLREALSALQKVGRSDAGEGEPAQTRYAVRRLTPKEAERLQAFPDNYTRIPWRGKPAEECPDGPRYKALGNSWCRNVVLWIGRRIQLVEEIKTSMP